MVRFCFSFDQVIVSLSGYFLCIYFKNCPPVPIWARKLSVFPGSTISNFLKFANGLVKSKVLQEYNFIKIDSKIVA